VKIENGDVYVALGADNQAGSADSGDM
jgi:hypothetical protein